MIALLGLPNMLVKTVGKRSHLHQAALGRFFAIISKTT